MGKHTEPELDLPTIPLHLGPRHARPDWEEMFQARHRVIVRKRLGVLGGVAVSLLFVVTMFPAESANGTVADAAPAAVVQDQEPRGGDQLGPSGDQTRVSGTSASGTATETPDSRSGLPPSVDADGDSVPGGTPPASGEQDGALSQDQDGPAGPVVPAGETTTRTSERRCK